MKKRRRPILCQIGFHSWCLNWTLERQHYFCNHCFVERSYP